MMERFNYNSLEEFRASAPLSVLSGQFTIKAVWVNGLELGSSVGHGYHASLRLRGVKKVSVI